MNTGRRWSWLQTRSRREEGGGRRKKEAGEGRREEGGGQATNIKFNNPQLGGGEKGMVIDLFHVCLGFSIENCHLSYHCSMENPLITPKLVPHS